MKAPKKTKIITGIEMANRPSNPNQKNELRYEGIEFLQASGWQRSDQNHPSGNGKLGYRAVYKTLKIIPLPSIDLSWPNLKVRLVVESVEYGGFNVKGNAIPSIFPNKLLLPEYIKISRDDKLTTYHGNTNMKWEFAAYQEEFPSSGVVELLLEVDNTNENDMITSGRRRVSPILTILDLVYGERIIGALITEEVVELFPDGHIITPEGYNFWEEPIGRLFGKRSNLVHGISNDVDEYEIIILRWLAKILLGNRLGNIEDPKLVENVISLVKIHFKQEI